MLTWSSNPEPRSPLPCRGHTERARGALGGQPEAWGQGHTVGTGEAGEVLRGSVHVALRHLTCEGSYAGFQSNNLDVVLGINISWL